MNRPRDSFETSLDFYYAAPADHGSARIQMEQAGQLALSTELFTPADCDIVSEGAEEFLRELYDTDRYGLHNDRIMGDVETYSTKEDIVDPETTEIFKMAIGLHDFVEHAILKPEQTADKLGLPQEAAAEIKSSALVRYGEMYETVENQDGLVKAFLFAIDASKWESAGRIWRQGATGRIADMMDEGILDAGSGAILHAAIKNKTLLEFAEEANIESVLKRHCLLDLKLDTISNGMLNYNLEGLFLKGMETLDILKYPPRNNPASTYRDATEAINFFVPALAAVGYKKLAMDLRGEALKFFYDDPAGNAARQHLLSAAHFDDINTMVLELRNLHFGGIDLEINSRVKSEGSLRQKLASDDYKDCQLVPDGVGFALVVPDEMAGAEMEYFARSFMQGLRTNSSRIEAKHPTGAYAFENLQSGERASGYKAIHMTFYYYPDNGSGDSVPFEIQVVTKSQDKMHLYGRASHLFRKADTSYSPADQPHLDRLSRRAQAIREIAPGSTIHSIAEMVATSPEIPTVFNKLFRAVDTPNGARILVPAELEKAAHEIFDSAEERFGKPGDLCVLPAAKLNERQFFDALRMFNQDLPNNKNIINALALTKSSEANSMRDDGKTTVLDGHILPATLAAVMLAIQSGRQWDNKQFDPNEHIADVAAIGLLHDYVEKALEGAEGFKVKMQIRQQMLYSIRSKFGQTIMGGVDALTLPVEITDEFDRRERNKAKIEANEYARDIKPADRWQNHITDLIKLADSDAPAASSDYQKIMKYFAKSDRHLSGVFTSPRSPKTYARAHEAIWRFARHYGYQQ